MDNYFKENGQPVLEHVALLHLRTLSDLMFLSWFGNMDGIRHKRGFKNKVYQTDSIRIWRVICK